MLKGITYCTLLQQQCQRFQEKVILLRKKKAPRRKTKS